ncbi:hypothetical protein DFH09DRAFT_1465795 [Mycena vulgaris]|nr:hypothetical protein DFH09DRAFT_1465795 [Mycena vulgaris]
MFFNKSAFAVAAIVYSATAGPLVSSLFELRIDAPPAPLRARITFTDGGAVNDASPVNTCDSASLTPAVDNLIEFANDIQASVGTFDQDKDKCVSIPHLSPPRWSSCPSKLRVPRPGQEGPPGDHLRPRAPVDIYSSYVSNGTQSKLMNKSKFDLARLPALPLTADASSKPGEAGEAKEMA